eukprot:TRINITY_DN67381_c10_g1_i1.p1 TRINITY_DN67381_c10_g1~~TRINITY_DN67381_c10_g1_i1.p1  ORF type:complete len:498 (+),score=116.11 TRINITY_DN67381_c10_g1_i1:127-1494(+)
MAKFRKKQKELDQRAKEVARSVPAARKDREEMEQLKLQVEGLQDEIQTKESKWRLERDRLKKQVDDLKETNRDLTQRLQELQLEAIHSRERERDREREWKREREREREAQEERERERQQREREQQQQMARAGAIKQHKETSADQQQSQGHSDLVAMAPQLTDGVSAQTGPRYSPAAGGGAVQQISSNSSSYSEIQKSTVQATSDSPPTTLPADGSGAKMNMAGVYRYPQQGQPNQGGAPTTTTTQPPTTTSAATTQPAGSAQPPKMPPSAETDDDEESPVEDPEGDEMIHHRSFPDGKIERLYSSGKREILYTNGTVKKYLRSGHVVLHFSNGDVKKTFPSSKIIYYYALAQTTHITYPNGLQVFEFINEQVEKHHPDGMKEIIFPDGTIKYIYSNSNEASIQPSDTPVPPDVAKKMIRSSTKTTVAKAFNLSLQTSAGGTGSTGSTDGPGATVF